MVTELFKNVEFECPIKSYSNEFKYYVISFVTNNVNNIDTLNIENIISTNSLNLNILQNNIIKPAIKFKIILILVIECNLNVNANVNINKYILMII